MLHALADLAVIRIWGERVEYFVIKIELALKESCRYAADDKCLFQPVFAHNVIDAADAAGKFLLGEVEAANFGGYTREVVGGVHLIDVIILIGKFPHRELREYFVHGVLGVALILPFRDEFLHLLDPSRRVVGAQLVEGLEGEEVLIKDLYRDFLNAAVCYSRLEVLFGQRLAPVDTAEGTEF